MVIFKLSKKKRKKFFCLFTGMGQRKNSEYSQGIKPQTFGFHTQLLCILGMIYQKGTF